MLRVERRDQRRRCGEVLRVRRYHGYSSTKTYLDWKGATELRDVYKVREEVTTPVEDFDSLEKIIDGQKRQIEALTHQRTFVINERNEAFLRIDKLAIDVHLRHRRTPTMTGATCASSVFRLCRKSKR